MSDYGTENDGGYGVDDYGTPPVTMPAGTPLTPQVISRAEIPVMPPEPRPRAPRAPAPMTSNPLRGLGDFSPAGVCTIQALSKVLYRFFTEVSTGTTVQSLGTLNVFRALYNSHRADFIGGFNAAAQALLPSSLPAAEWSTALRQVAAIVLAGGLGNGHPAVETLSALPPAISGITAWFISFRNALTPGNMAPLREYLELPAVPGSAPDVVLARAINDDLRTCGMPIQPPPPPATPPRVNPSSPSTSSGGGASAGAGQRPPTAGASAITQGALPVGAGVGNLMTVGLVVLVGYGLYKAVNEKAPTPKHSRLGEYKHPDLVAKAKRAAARDAKDVRCVIAADERAMASMDESAGPSGERFAAILAKLPPADATALEAVYFAELEKLVPKTCPKD